MNIRKIASLIAAAILLSGHISAQVNERSIFPLTDGKMLSYKMYDADGKLLCSYKMTVRNAKGNLRNGSLDMVFNYLDENGKPLFSVPNEFITSVSKVDGKTHTTISSLSQLTKVQNLMSLGDGSHIPVDMTIGQLLPDSTNDVKIGKIKASASLTGKKVKEHKQITTKAGTFDCWLVHEDVETKTPVSTTHRSAETWYSEGVNIVKQTIYDSKGKVTARIELVGVR